MTKTEALKELLRSNIENLNFDAYFDPLSIEFKENKFIILDNSKKVILKDSLNKYNLEYDKQKKICIKRSK